MTAWPHPVRALFWLCCLSGLVLALIGAQAAPDKQTGIVPEIPLDGPVGPANAAFVTDAISQAATDGAPLVILRIDTPGGLMSSMRDIVQAILASPVPIVGYVAPAGARAASAGTYILYASHVAAAAPATHLGAATPVEIGGGASGETPSDAGQNAPDDADTSSSPNGNNQPDISSDASARRKQINDAVAYIRSLAEQRGRNADWAERAVREAATLSAAEARDQQVIDRVADNETALLTALNGRTVKTATGQQTLHTEDLRIHRIEPGWRTELLATVTNPTIAYLLFMIGIVGLAAEALNPGATLPGIVGGISLLTALYAFHMLPVDYTGAALILLGAALITAEAFVPSFGALGLGGLAALLFGSIMLGDTPGYEVSMSAIVVIALTTAALLGLVVALFARARRTPTETGHEGLIGRECTARRDFSATGRVWLHGESWQAETDTPVTEGQNLIVTAVDGLTVHVRPKTEGSPEP
ncbi:nodulation protein NfeD [Salinisphaera sp. Q1T1-3]|uniref:NfeD family protein n=1 Tax=Salinisphaera sp. Q1T1-3 TaxID=2321229 RepID=UPI000E70D8E6|nr:nodulation protein NfeD [Salinisphaera sp. Q1T1-3]RJS95060.1 nodulation protein NfeD [Salinisphaera sp. Q1T1-3]